MFDFRKGLLSLLLSQFSGCFKLSVSLFEYCLVSAIQLVGWCYKTNGTVKSDGVVVFDVLFYYPSGVVKGKWDTRTDAFGLDGLVKSLQLAV
jgi:hypothetical protein